MTQRRIFLGNVNDVFTEAYGLSIKVIYFFLADLKMGTTGDSIQKFHVLDRFNFLKRTSLGD